MRTHYNAAVVRGWIFAVGFLAACSPASSAPSTSAVGDGAGAPAPRLLAPASASFSTSRQPTFRWTLARGTDGARIEICRDRGCAQLVTAADATGDAWTPAVALPSGVLFWRLHPIAAGRIGDSVSASWELVSPFGSAPLATTWGSLIDANGDGFADVVVGDSNSFTATQHVYVHLGSAGGPSLAPSAVLSATAPVDHYATSLASAGDLDGDGYPELAVGSPNEDTVYVYRGGPSGYAEPPALLLKGPAKTEFGFAVGGAGDVNGDGYADLVVGFPIAAPTAPSAVQGAARVYFGSASGISPGAFVALAPAAGSDEQGFGQYVSGAGDLDGDGRADVAVYGGVGSFDPQRIYVYLGGSHTFGAAPDLVLQYDGSNTEWLDNAAPLACAGDLDGDGYADLAMGTPVPFSMTYQLDHVSIFPGGPSGPGPLPAMRLNDPLATGDHFGLGLAPADFDGDGVEDLAVSTLAYELPSTSAVVYRGDSLSPALVARIATEETQWYNERELGGAGDVDGDGYPDLVVGYPERKTPSSAPAPDGGTTTLQGAVEVYRGGPHGLATAASWTLLPPDGTAVAYGATLARP